MTVFIASVFMALSVSFFCSLAEACLLSLSQTDVARMSEHRPAAARIWKHFRSNIQRPIAVILIINTLAHTIGASLSGAQFHRLFGSQWIALYSIVFSLIMIQWTEILPKSLGVKYNRRLATLMAVPLNSLVLLFRPLVDAVEFINRPFDVHKRHAHADSPTSDITVLASYAALNNQISREQEQIIARSIQMSKAMVGEVMVPREEMGILSTTMTLTEGLISSHVHRHTRFPLAEDGDIDRIIGYVNFKDIVGALHMNPTDPTLKGIRRDVVYVQDTTRIPDLLRRLTRGYQHFAIVQDANGKTRGLVTLEDIVETLVGDLSDEYDVAPELVVQLSETRFRVGGGATMEQLRKRAFADAPQTTGTVSDLIRSHLGDAVAEQSSVTVGRFHFKVRRIVRGLIYDVIVERT